jgi:hypothetical protein
MEKRVKLKSIFFVMVFSIILGGVADRSQAERFENLNEILPRLFNYTNPPPPYENYSWKDGKDFAFIRDEKVPFLKGANVVAWSTLGATIGALVGGTTGVAIGLGAGQSLPNAWTLFSDSVGNLISAGVEYSWGTWVWPVSLMEVINRLDSELGISDYYVFARAVRLDPILYTTFPIGAWVELDFNEMKLRKDTLFKQTPLIGANPVIFRVNKGELDFDLIDARVYERDLSGKYRTVTIDKIFTYEYFQGKIIPKGSQGKTHQMLTVLKGHPDPKHGGKIIGKAELKYLPGIGIAGLREIHLCSPVNDGLLFKEGDRYAFTINLDANTVSVENASSGPEQPKVNEELAIRVMIKGLHNLSDPHLDASDGTHYLWNNIVFRVLEDARCEGSGITDTQIQHTRKFSLFRCIPKKEGDIYVVLQTIDGPVRFKAASIKTKGRSCEECIRKYCPQCKSLLFCQSNDMKCSNCIEKNQKKINKCQETQ